MRVMLGTTVGGSTVSSGDRSEGGTAGAELALLVSASHVLFGGVADLSPGFLDGPEESHGGALLGYEHRSGSFRLQLLGEFGAHSISNVGNGLFSHPVEGPASANLTYGGARVGISGQRGPFVFGVWGVVRHDFETQGADLSIESDLDFDLCLFPPCGDTGPSVRAEHFEMGGTQIAFVLYAGVDLGD